MDDFARSFNNADVLFVLDIYAASEAPIEGITAEILTEKIKQYGHKNVQYIGDIESAAEKVVEQFTGRRFGDYSGRGKRDAAFR